MVVNVVLLKLYDPSWENIERVREILTHMDDSIEELHSVEVGIDLIHGTSSYDVSYISEFNSVDALRAYINHPLHQESIREIFELSESVASVQYERA